MNKPAKRSPSAIPEEQAPFSDISEVFLTEIEHRRKRLRYLLRMIHLEAARENVRPQKCRKLRKASHA